MNIVHTDMKVINFDTMEEFFLSTHEVLRQADLIVCEGIVLKNRLGVNHKIADTMWDKLLGRDRERNGDKTKKTKIREILDQQG